MGLSNKNLKLIGASLYLCEGIKARVDNRGQKNFSVEFTNKDPRMIRLFLNFLRKIVKPDEERIKAQLFIYPDHKEEELIEFWSKITKIPFRRFTKTILLRQKNVRYKPNPLGTLKIRCHSKDHFLKIQNMIEEIFGKEKKWKDV